MPTTSSWGSVVRATGTSVCVARRCWCRPAGPGREMRTRSADRRAHREDRSASAFAVDPSQSFVAATRSGLPVVNVRQAPAEVLRLPMGPSISRSPSSWCTSWTIQSRFSVSSPTHPTSRACPEPALGTSANFRRGRAEGHTADDAQRVAPASNPTAAQRSRGRRCRARCGGLSRSIVQVSFARHGYWASIPYLGGVRCHLGHYPTTRLSCLRNPTPR